METQVAGAPRWEVARKINATTGAEVQILTARATLHGVGIAQAGQRRMEILITIAEREPGHVMAVAAERYPEAGMAPARIVDQAPTYAAAQALASDMLRRLGAAVEARDAAGAVRMPGVLSAPLPVAVNCIRYN